jgi:hypothetical protein
MSGDSPREQTAGPVLPVVNADVKETQPAKQTLPSFVYVVYVPSSLHQGELAWLFKPPARPNRTCSR